MKKALYSFVLALVAFSLLVSCEQDFYDGTSLSRAEAIAEFGDVNHIYETNGSRTLVTIELPSTENPRFYTGQHINGFMGYDVVFEASLVEYRSINAKILEYIENNVVSNNALMHQNYPGFTSENIDPNMKYVEFATYSDYETGKVLYHEVRVFWGNFMDTFNESFWYAKSVLFSPNLQIDVRENININSGKYAYYEPNANKYKPSNNPDSGSKMPVVSMRETSYRTELMERLGDVNRVFAWYSDDELDLIDMFGGHTIFAECYLVELNSLSSEVIEATAGRSTTGLHQRGWDILSVEGKEYVEVIYYNDTSNPAASWVGLRLRAEKMPNFTYGYYAVSFSL